MNTASSDTPDFGALVISLDFELHWGRRDTLTTTGPYRQNFLGVWPLVPRLLQLFEEYEVAATWATVGLLFASSREEQRRYFPELKPEYINQALYPYDESVGENEADDPFHYAPSLIEAIKKTPRQELATHTFSHYYCLEPGQNRDTFAADLASAAALAQTQGTSLRSIVFPRNQHNPDYDDVLRDAGILCYRGNQRAWMYEAEGGTRHSPYKRISRLLDTYLKLAGSHCYAWDSIVQPGGLSEVPASFFMRPYSRRLGFLDGLRLKRITSSLREAARQRKIVHLWWHPHNFGTNIEQNLAFLRAVLEEFAVCRERYNMRSLSMLEVSEMARERKAVSL